MKKLFVLTVLVSLLVVTTAGISHAGKLIGGNRTVDISLTGFCDGLHLVINPNSGFVTGNMTGCDSGVVFGTVSSLFGTGKGVALTIRDTKYTWYKVIRDSGTWTYYDSTGAIFNQGTFTLGTPALPIGDSGNSNQ